MKGDLGDRRGGGVAVLLLEGESDDAVAIAIAQRRRGACWGAATPAWSALTGAAGA